MLMVERLAPGRPLERVVGWYRRAILLNAVQAAFAYVATVSWDRWFPDLALWHAGGFGLLPDALVGYVAITFIYYWWHRARHEIPFLWRWLHQVHHSPRGIELITSFYKHPLEIARQRHPLERDPLLAASALSAEARRSRSCSPASRSSSITGTCARRIGSGT